MKRIHAPLHGAITRPIRRGTLCPTLGDAAHTVLLKFNDAEVAPDGDSFDIGQFPKGFGLPIWLAVIFSWMKPNKFSVLLKENGNSLVENAHNAKTGLRVRGCVKKEFRLELGLSYLLVWPLKSSHFYALFNVSARFGCAIANKAPNITSPGSSFPSPSPLGCKLCGLNSTLGTGR